MIIKTIIRIYLLFFFDFIIFGYLIFFVFFFVFFFFKQKTAYEISECDWSSDVCSSDLSHKQKTTYEISECDWNRKSTRLNSSHIQKSRMPSSACDWSSDVRSEEHTSELQSHSEISYAVFCLKKNK